MSIAAKLAAVEERISLACQASGRAPKDVTLLPVSKTWPVSMIQEVMERGYSKFGESRPQEIASKAAELSGTGAQLVAIGRLQTNKAKLVAQHAAQFQALDSTRLATELNRQAGLVGRVLPVLLQVNTSNEPQKGGVAPAELAGLVDHVLACQHLAPQGLMTIAARDVPQAQVRASFATLRAAQSSLRQAYPETGWDELSMGMSSDLELAIAEGSTCLRVGQAIFGARVLT